jgi:hypothetical protein
MRIIEFIVLSYYIVLRKAKRNQLQASVYGAATSPLTFLIAFIVIFFTKMLFPNNSFFVPINIGILIFIVGFFTNSLLYSYYKRQQKRLDEISTKYERVRLLFIIPIIFYFLFSIFILFYSFRFI